MTMDANDFLMRGGTPAVKFPTIGSTVAGMIIRQPKMADVTDPASGEVKRWPNGDAKQQVIIELQTELREAEDDDGQRTLWAKGQMQTAIRDAVRAAGAKGLEVEGILQVTLSGEKPTNLNPQKLYTARYWPPQGGFQVPASTPWEAEADRGAPGGWSDRGQQQQTFSRPPADTHSSISAPAQASQGRVAARPVSTPPAPHDPSISFLERLRQTSANQQAYRDQSVNHRGEPQDDEPPY